MRSHEVLRKASESVGVKALAAELRLSPALVYKWCQEWDPGDPDAGGARNPLDRLADIMRVTGDRGIARWLCHEAGGFFVTDPGELPYNVSAELLLNTQRMVKDFSDLLMTVTKSIADDGLIEPWEADRIRDSWELFKSTVEAFTAACERGLFNRKGLTEGSDKTRKE